MKIECILKRLGGTKAEIGGIEYHFEPQTDGAHVADVTEKAHIARFLSMPEGYAVYQPDAEPQKAVIMLLGSNVHPATFDINGKTYSLGDVVAKAAAGFDADDWNGLSDDARADLIDEELDKLKAETGDLNGDGVVDNKDERIALVEAYEAKFGKKPNGRASLDTLRKALAE
jgi:hypothetical protein